MDPKRYPVSNHQHYHAETQQFPYDVPSVQTQFHMQAPGQPHLSLPFDPHIMGPPPTSNICQIPNISYPFGMSQLTEQSVSASALERLQLPKDKITETGIIPNNPYYKLPAGLMVPLVPAWRNDYKPIEPGDLRLPFPKFPDENFLRMIDSYYAKDEDKRDNDGWERKFIDTYLKQKEALSKMQSESEH